MTRIYDENARKTYVERRLGGDNVSLYDVRCIEHHSGIKNTDLLAKLPDSAELVVQQNPREPMYFDKMTSKLYFAEWSGFRRFQRYVSLMQHAKQINPGLEHHIHYPHENRRFQRVFYNNHAYDFVKVAVVPELGGSHRRVFDDGDIKNIDTIIFGPTKAVAKQANVLKVGKSDYIDSQLIEIGGRKAFNIGYVYGDQMAILLEKIFGEFQALQAPDQPTKPMTVYFFGRAGGLNENMQRHDIAFPTGTFDDSELEAAILGSELRGSFTSDENILAPSELGKGEFQGHNCNMRSILDQTVEDLETAKRHSITLDMEFLYLRLSIARLRLDYSESLHPIRLGTVFHISDRPLVILPDGRRDTLALELDSDEGEQKAVKSILNHMCL